MNLNAGLTTPFVIIQHEDYRRGMIDFVEGYPYDYECSLPYEYGRLVASWLTSEEKPVIIDNVFAMRDAFNDALSNGVFPTYRKRQESEKIMKIFGEGYAI